MQLRDKREKEDERDRGHRDGFGVTKRLFLYLRFVGSSLVVRKRSCKHQLCFSSAVLPSDQLASRASVSAAQTLRGEEQGRSRGP